ncbi:glycosyltransferase family 2 protein [Photobacterium damselae]|uniref:glycosyltransferase family 2 protein n=1 Tax=Photobacterium damselae TaxID=38293 RepID=UPI00165DC22D|nr:glycosyltransferase family 2 protein [Photobacterium damselae]
MTITAIILTYNEEKHIRRCIESLIPLVDEILILDSYSNDKTLDIASEYDLIEIKQNKFLNYATQFNKALDIFDIKSDWVMRIDADEYIDSACSSFLKDNILTLSNDINGIYLNRYMTFLGRLMLHGGMDSYWMLRMWRNGYGRCEQRWMDEHILLSSGNTVKATGKLVDDNLNTLSWWAHKHVDYSTREAIDILLKEKNSSKQLKADFFGSKSEKIRFLKNSYNKLPLFIRPFFYFIYRYFIKMGFRDGKEGFLWCVFQGFWYRMMVDAKVFEIKKFAKLENKSISVVIKEKYGYEI